MTTSTYERIIAAAAEARAAGVRAPADRPSQRRCAEELGSRSATVVRAQSIQLRAVGDGAAARLHFEGFASVYNRGYEMWDMFGPYTEDVASGAGAESLARADLDVPLVLQHESMRRIARTTNGTLTLDEREQDGAEGLYVDAPELDPTDPDVAYIAHKLSPNGERAPLIDEMSFKFRILVGIWSPDWEAYRIEKYDIHRGDVAIVAYGANPHTVGAGLRALPALSELTDSQLRSVESELHRVRAQRATGSQSAPMSPAVARAIEAAARG